MRGNDRFPVKIQSKLHGRQQIAQGLAYARSGLHQQRGVHLESPRYGQGHILLLRPVFKIPGAGEQPVRGKCPVDISLKGANAFHVICPGASYGNAPLLAHGKLAGGNRRQIHLFRRS